MELMEVPEERMCTSLEQQWHKPRGATIEPEPVMNVIFARPNPKRKRQPLMCSFRSTSGMEPPTIQEVDFKHAIKDTGRPLSYILTTSQVTNIVELPVGPIPQTSTLYHQLKYFNSGENENQDGYPALPLRSNVIASDLNSLPIFKVTLEEAIELERKTRGQNSKAWHDARKIRLTASDFGVLCKRKKKVDDDFLGRLFDVKNLDSVRSISYGKRNELKARQAYVDYMISCHKNICVSSCGIVINPDIPFLGCSPDGKVIDQTESPEFGLLEIKCPYSKQHKSLEEMCTDKKFYCGQSNGNLLLKETSHAYYQVQGQMLVTGTEWCDFVVFNGHNVFVQRVKKNYEFCDQMLQTLCSFYERHWHNFISVNTKS